MFRHIGNPVLSFGDGAFAAVPEQLRADDPVLLLTGIHFSRSPALSAMESALRGRGIRYMHEIVRGEPTPESIDSLTASVRDFGPRLVVSVGGGSVLDTGKAVAAMLLHDGSVIEYLEGVGTRKPEGRTVPTIAAPTTAGTGSEATKNAVVGRRGPGGFKKSLRHDAFVPALAVVDPVLSLGCPPEVTLSCGMDAFSQLLESWTSTGTTPLSDMYAREAIVRFRLGSRLFDGDLYGSVDEIRLRADLAFAAYCSGITLANAGLGTVHGIAGPLCGRLDVPHGVACARLAAPVFRRITERLAVNGDKNVLDRLAWAGAVITRGPDAVPGSDDVERLLDRLETWAGRLPGLGRYGLDKAAIDEIAAVEDNKSSPVKLDAAERRAILASID